VLVDEEVISYPGDMLVLAGHEGCHVVERNCFHRSEFGRNGLFPLCLPSILGFPKIASMLTPVICRWPVIWGQPTVSIALSEP